RSLTLLLTPLPTPNPTPAPTPLRARASAYHPEPLLVLRPGLQNSFGLLQLPLPGRGEVLAGPVDEVLNHPDPGRDPARAHTLPRHGPGNGFGVLGEYPRRWKGRNRLHLLDPLLLFRDHGIPPLFRSSVCCSSNAAPRRRAAAIQWAQNLHFCRSCGNPAGHHASPFLPGSTRLAPSGSRESGGAAWLQHGGSRTNWTSGGSPTRSSTTRTRSPPRSWRKGSTSAATASRRSSASWPTASRWRWCCPPAGGWRSISSATPSGPPT